MTGVLETLRRGTALQEFSCTCSSSVRIISKTLASISGWLTGSARICSELNYVAIVRTIIHVTVSQELILLEHLRRGAVVEGENVGWRVECYRIAICDFEDTPASLNSKPFTFLGTVTF
jgi:hypothetical protein